MLDTSYSNFFTSGYYIFANGILLVALAVVMYGFDTELAKRSKFRWLAAGVLSAGISRTLFSFYLLQHSPVFLLLDGIFALLCRHFYAEYLRRSFHQERPLNPILLHLPLFLVLLYGFWFSGIEHAVRALALLIIGLLVCYAGFKNANQLPQEVSKYILGCFALAAAGFVMQIGARLRLQINWQTLEPLSGAPAMNWQLVLPSLVIVAIIVLAMLARHAREKLHWHSLRGDLGLYSHLIFLLVIVLVLFAGAIVGGHLIHSSQTNALWLLITLTLVSLIVIQILNSAVINIRSREDYAIAEERFKTVFYHAPESMIIISARNLEILEANHGMIRQFGLHDNIVGASYFSLLPTERNNITNVWHDSKEKLFKHQRTFVKRGGEQFSAEVTGAPITFNHQKALILLLHDITAQKQIELELRQAKNVAENANKLKTRFFANASHEIRTPMTAIIGLTEMALTMCQSSEQQKVLSLTRSSGKSLLELVNDILDLSKIESGKFSIKPEAFDLHLLLKELEQLFEFEAAQRPIKIEFALDSSLPYSIVSDAVRIRQILINLLNNALKFTSKGEVKLMARAINGETKSEIEIKVCDTGSGISREIQEHLFEPFIDSDQYTRHQAKGAGLGLAICKQITDLLAGNLFVEKTSCTGTIFTLIIPFERVEAKPKQSDSLIVQNRLIHNGRPLHFLIADDNEINLFLAGSIIEKHGGSHEFAHNGREALEKLTANTYDLALIDIQMPELDGLEVIRRVRQADRQLAGIPIIAVSAFISDQEKQDALQAGANSYLVKPYFPKDLLRAVEQLLEIDRPEGRHLDSVVENTQGDTSTISMESTVLKQIDAGELEIRILKKPENILKISDIFARRSIELLAELAECEQSNDCFRLREVTHSIKGLVGMLGAKKTFQLALDLETLCKDGLIESVLPQLPMLKVQIAEISQDLKVLQQQVSKKTV
ncbi:MAG: response regulator [Candidatus Riflebacteria bacterium]|nr:response regulator [Candidatus Riflebacteria bacterium]